MLFFVFTSPSMNSFSSGVRFARKVFHPATKGSSYILKLDGLEGQAILPIYFSFNKTITTNSYLFTNNLTSGLYPKFEDDAAHKVMETIEAYSKTIVLSPGCPQFSLYIKEESIYAKLYKVASQNFLDEQLGPDHEKFDELLCDVAKNLHSATYEEILQTLHCIAFWPSARAFTGLYYRRLWGVIDRECVKRLPKWSISQKLLVADYLFHLRLCRYARYNAVMIKDLVAKRDMLTCSEIVQLFLYINAQRNVPQSLLNQLEKNLESVVEKVSIRELSVICLGYFKTGNGVQNLNILRKLLERSSIEMDGLQNVHVTGIVKCLRSSRKTHITGYYSKFLNTCSKYCQKFGLLESVHLALLSHSTSVFEPVILDNAIEKLSKNLHEARIKDISKLIQCLAFFNYLPRPEFNDQLLMEVLKKERNDELIQHPHDFLYIAAFYAQMGLYNADILRKVMSQDIITCIPESEYRSFAVLDYSIDIECNGLYDGLRLGKHQRNQIIADYYKRHSLLDDDRNSFIMVTTKSILQCLKDTDEFQHNVGFVHVLPHMHNPDIVVRLHPRTSNALPLCEVLKNYPQYEVITPPPGERWACIFLCGFSSYAHKSGKLCGPMVMKERQLSKLGYEVLVVNVRNVPKNHVQMKILLKKKLEALEKNSSPHMSMVQ